MQTNIHAAPTTFTELRGVWDDLLKRSLTDTIFLTYDWQSTWWEYFNQDKDLLLLAIHSDDRLIGIAPLYIFNSPEGKRTIQIIGGVDICDYLDLIADREQRDAVYAAVLDYLSRDPAWDVLDLHCLPAASPTHQTLAAMARQRGYTVEVKQENVCPLIRLPSAWEEYLESLPRKDRHELRRKMRRAQEDAEITYQGVDDPAALSAGMEVFFDLHRRSEGEKAAFMTEQMKGFFRAMAAFSLERRWLELRFLLIDGYRAASLINFAYGNDILAYNVGYDPDRYAYLSSGTVLFAGAIREAIERGKSTFDFLRGSEEYKYRFGAQDTPIYQLTIGK